MGRCGVASESFTRERSRHRSSEKEQQAKPSPKGAPSLEHGRRTRDCKIPLWYSKKRFFRSTPSTCPSTRKHATHQLRTLGELARQICEKKVSRRAQGTGEGQSGLQAALANLQVIRCNDQLLSVVLAPLPCHARRAFGRDVVAVVFCTVWEFNEVGTYRKNL
jgi:hypothetical protein